MGEANFLPDGRGIVFDGRENGRARIYVQPLDGAPRAISPEGVLTEVVTTPDGHFVVGRLQGKHMLFAVDGGPPRELPHVSRDDFALQWSPDGRFLYVTRDAWPHTIDRIVMQSER